MKSALVLPIAILLMCSVPGAEAAKKKPPLLPVQTLTLQEQWCAYFGRMVGAMATDRDNLVPLTVTLGRLRTIMADVFKRIPYARAAQTTEEVLGIARGLYAAPLVSPVQARHMFEIGCLVPGVTTGDTKALWR